MSFDDQPLSAIDRVRIAYEQMVERKREAAMAREARERRRVVRLVVAGSAMIAMLICTAIYNDWLPSARSFMPGDASAEFKKSRTGQVRSYVKGNTCQELQFNNASGTYIGGNLVPCDAPARRAAQESSVSSGSRVFSIRDAFTR